MLKKNTKVAWIDPDSEKSAIFKVVKDYDDVIILKNDSSEVEAFAHEIQSLEDTYCCFVCGCIDIQEQGWFLVNKKEPTQIIDMVENAPIWCPSCDAPVSKSITCDEYEKKQVLKKSFK